MESHRRGDLTESRVIAELCERQIPVARPFSDNERYDLIVESPDGLYRAQIKTGWLTGGCVQFRGWSQHTNASGNVYKLYDDDVDFFIVFSPELSRLFLVKESEFDTSMFLRVEEPEIAQPSINWAEDYEFDERWPPGSDTDVLAADHREAVLRVLDEQDVCYLDTRDRETAEDVLLRTPSDTFVRTVIRFGSESEGRLRFDTGNQQTPGPTEIDAVLVFREESETMYLVEQADSEPTCSLELSTSERSSTVAADFRFEDRWPGAFD